MEYLVHIKAEDDVVIEANNTTEAYIKAQELAASIAKTCDWYVEIVREIK